MLYDKISDALQVEFSLFDHLVEQNQMRDNIFPIIPDKEKMNKTVELKNYFENRFNAMLLLLNNDEAQKTLLNSLSINLDVKAKINIVMDCLNNYRVLINTGERTVSIINFKQLMAYKEEILSNDFFSSDWKQEFEKCSYQFYRLFLLETESIIKIVNEKEDMITSTVQPNDFINAAVMTNRKYLKVYGEENIKFLFEYFFIRFTDMYQHLDYNLYEFRGRLMESLATELSGYSYSKGNA